jgi:hypothetical protein
MGSSTYSYSDRSSRAKSSGYYDKPASDVFTQSKKREIHESMDPKKITLRECRDSEAHPFTVPIVLTLDVTGSMHDIPKDLIKDGLPSMMSSMIQNGVKDASLLFLAVGDHECDKAPLQVGQFESGDSELDLWLTRTWLEGGGGANAGRFQYLTN